MRIMCQTIEVNKRDLILCIRIKIILHCTKTTIIIQHIYNCVWSLFGPHMAPGQPWFSYSQMSPWVTTVQSTPQTEISLLEASSVMATQLSQSEPDHRGAGRVTAPL